MRNLVFIIFCFITWACNLSSGNNNTNGKSIDSLHTDFTFRPLSQEEISYYRQEIKNFYERYLATKGFNGSILVAKNGEILFEDYKGFYNFLAKEPLTEHTPLHLASISKTFTAVTVLKLWEQGRISLNDTLQKFFPELPYSGITVKTLLNHRSGLPNYLYFLDTIWNKEEKVTNWDVVNLLVAHKPPIAAPPNRMYNYCNTNYMLLALIIEIVTRQPYPQYMKDSVFTPLGLKDTYVFSIADTASYVPTYSVTKPFVMDYVDCTYGDKNIYSTVRDLLQWDKALYQHTFVQKYTLDTAFTPYSHETRSMHNYGLGWHLFFRNGDTIIYHNGKWHGSNTAFTRLIDDTVTVIVLGNKPNNNIYLSREMQSIFTGKQVTVKAEEKF